MTLPAARPTTRLRALRHSHCRTCGCARCRRIDEVLEAAGQPNLNTHPETTGDWLLEGRLLSDGRGGWVIQSGETITPLSDSLSPWAGHHILLLIGARPAPGPDDT